MYNATTLLVTKQGIYYVYNVTVKNQQCHSAGKPGVVKETFYDYILTYTIGIWVPALILLILHIIMYLKLQRQAQKRMHTSTLDSTQQMQSILRTFSIIMITFFICVLPLSFLTSYRFYLVFSGQRKTFDDNANLFSKMSYILTCLQNVNCCINPLVYGKAHYKIYSVMKSFWKSLVQCSSRGFDATSILFSSSSSTTEITCNELKNKREGHLKLDSSISMCLQERRI